MPACRPGLGVGHPQLFGRSAVNRRSIRSAGAQRWAPGSRAEPTAAAQGTERPVARMSCSTVQCARQDSTHFGQIHPKRHSISSGAAARIWTPPLTVGTSVRRVVIGRGGDGRKVCRLSLNDDILRHSSGLGLILSHLAIRHD